jgi:peptidoglycan/LPS O-acetylase OafA/YrhL
MPRIAAEFTAGVMLHRLWELQEFPRGPRGDWIAIGSLLILIVGGNLLAIHIHVYLAVVYLPIFACGVIYGLASGTGIVCRVLSTGAAQWGGHVSYAFYMVHMLVLGVASRMLISHEKAASTPWVIAAVLIALLATTAVASAIHAAVETPARRGMVQWFSRVTGKASQEMLARSES